MKSCDVSYTLHRDLRGTHEKLRKIFAYNVAYDSGGAARRDPAGVVKCKIRDSFITLFDTIKHSITTTCVTSYTV